MATFCTIILTFRRIRPSNSNLRGTLYPLRMVLIVSIAEANIFYDTLKFEFNSNGTFFE